MVFSPKNKKKNKYHSVPKKKKTQDLVSLCLFSLLLLLVFAPVGELTKALIKASQKSKNPK